MCVVCFVWVWFALVCFAVLLYLFLNCVCSWLCVNLFIVQTVLFCCDVVVCLFVLVVLLFVCLNCFVVCFFALCCFVIVLCLCSLSSVFMFVCYSGSRSRVTVLIWFALLACFAVCLFAVFCCVFVMFCAAVLWFVLLCAGCCHMG